MLAKPIYVHTAHVSRMDCPRGCLGVEFNNHTMLHADEFRGCAVCEIAARHAVPAGTQTLRQCGNRLCHGRFHQTSYDEFHVPERVENLKHKAATLLRGAA